MASYQEPPSADDLRERPLPELLKQLSQETTQLLRQEIELAKAEVSEKGRKAGVGAGLFGGAGAVGLLAAGALTACFILALSEVMHPALAALLVAVVYGAIAAVLAIQGRRKVKEAAPPVPEQTVETVKEDVHGQRPRCHPPRNTRNRGDQGRDERDRRGDRLQGRRALADQGGRGRKGGGREGQR